MATEADICNLALSRLGDEATITSVTTPEESPQAEHCYRFYPMARDTLLEMCLWDFALKRKQLARRVVPYQSEWRFAYEVPNDCLRVVRVTPWMPPPPPLPPPGAEELTPPPVPQPLTPDERFAILHRAVPLREHPETPGLPKFIREKAIPYATEVDGEGCRLILTDHPNPGALYVSRVEDTQKFSPLFTDALSWLLASYLAGVLIKGDVGMTVAQHCLKAFQLLKQQAELSNARQNRTYDASLSPWIAARW